MTKQHFIEVLPILYTKQFAFATVLALHLLRFNNVLKRIISGKTILIELIRR